MSYAKVNEPGSSRLFYLDYLRVALVMLVVVHHVAMVYGAGAPFYYMEPPPITQFRAFQGLLVFILFNQSFFMGALFLLAGYFTPGSFDRKGAAPFLRDKSVRLGLPLLFFALVLHPVSGLATWLMPASLTGLTRQPTWAEYPGLIGLGPSWFIAMLLVFSVGYALWRIVSRAVCRRNAGDVVEAPGPNEDTGSIGLVRSLVFLAGVAIGLAGVSYLWRMVIPLGRTILGFPTLAYLPQYLGFFALGVIAYRRNWLQRLPGVAGIVGLLAAAVAAVLLFPLAFSGQPFSLDISPRLANAFGNGHWQSAIYAAWDSIFSVGITASLIALFRSVANRRSTIGSFLSAQSYTVYLLHAPLLVYLAYLIRGIDFTAIPKFAVATAIVVPICFLAAWLVRRLPGTKSVL